MAKLTNHFKVADPAHIYAALHKGQRARLFDMCVKAGGDKS